MSTYKNKLEKIHALLEEAENLFRELPSDLQNRLTALHHSAGSLSHCLNAGETAARECLESSTAHPIYGYYIDLDERGEFKADVRDANGRTVFWISAPDDDGGSIFEDGFMSDKNDLDGLCEYLRSMKTIPDDGVILSCNEFERLVDLSDHANPDPDQPVSRPKAKSLSL